MQARSLVLIAICACLFQASFCCKSLAQNDKIQTGALKLENSLAETETSYWVQLDFDSSKQPVDVAVSLSNLNGFVSEQGFNFALSASKKDNQNALLVSFASADGSWKRVDVTYIASSRADLYLGRISPDIKSSQVEKLNDGQQTISISHPLLPKMKNDSYNVVSYLSGIKTKDKELQLGISGVTVDTKSEVFLIKLLTNEKSTVDGLQLSVIVWGSFPFEMFEFVQSVTGFETDYKMEGAIGIANKSIISSGLAFKSEQIQCKGQGCLKNCVNVKECGGQIIKNICFMCKEKEFVDATGECKAGNCSANEEIVGEKCECKKGINRVKGVCQQCVSNSYYDIGKQDCVCNYGYYKSQESCVPCHQNCGACNGAGFKSCINCIDKTFTFNKGECTQVSCQKQYFINEVDRKCTRCQQNCMSCSTFQKCDTCLDGYILMFQDIKSNCVKQKEQTETVTSVPTIQKETPSLTEPVVAQTKPIIKGDVSDSQISSPLINLSSNPLIVDDSPEVGQHKVSIVQGNGIIDSGNVYKGYTIRNLPEEALSTTESNLDKHVAVALTNATVIPTIKTQLIEKTSSALKMLVSFGFPGFQTPPPFSYKLKVTKNTARQQEDEAIQQYVDPSLLLHRVANNLRQSFDSILDFEINLSDEEVEFIFD